MGVLRVKALGRGRRAGGRLWGGGVKEGMGWGGRQEGGRRCAGKAGRENRRGEGEGEELPVRPRTRVTLTSLTGTLLESMAVNVLCVDVRCCLRAVVG